MRGMTWLIAAMTAVGGVVMADELDLLPLGDGDLRYRIGAASAGALVDAATGEEMALPELAAALARADVILVGEEHTHMAQKRFQERLLRALAARRTGLVLGMEFFERGDREVLQRWFEGELDDEGLREAVGWYDRGGFRWEYYAPLLRAAREEGVPVVGLNVPREIPRAVNRGGLENLDEAQRAEVGEIDVAASAEHRYLFARYMGETSAMLPPAWFANMYAAQVVWDTVMARSVLADLPEEGAMMVVAGTGHVSYGLGISRQLARETTGRLRVATVCPVLAPPPEEDGQPMGHPMGPGHGGSASPARFVRSLADYVAVFADTGGIEEYPRLGITLGETDDGIPTVGMVFPDSLAEQIGLEHGDRIVGLHESVPGSTDELRRRLSALEWGQRLALVVERDGERQTLSALLFPDPLLRDPEPLPGYHVEQTRVEATDTGIVVTAGEGEAGTPAEERLLVTAPDGARRLEVRRHGVLEEVHILDEEGRVTDSLYRTGEPTGGD